MSKLFAFKSQRGLYKPGSPRVGAGWLASGGSAASERLPALGLLFAKRLALLLGSTTHLAIFLLQRRLFNTLAGSGTRAPLTLWLEAGTPGPI